MYVDILFPLTKSIPIMFERVTTHFQTLKIWIDHNAMHYHKFNALPDALPYIFSQFTMIWGFSNGLPRFTINFIKRNKN